MAKTIYNYNFSTSGDAFIGTYSGPIPGTETAVSGELCEPGQIIKLSAGSNPWSQDAQIITDFLSNTLSIEPLYSTDWNVISKDEWLQDYMRYTGLSDLIAITSYYNYILAYAESINLFEELSAPSIAWVTKDSTSGEVSIGLNAYENTFIKDYAMSLPYGNIIRNAILDDHTTENVYITNTAKVTYNGFANVVYGFDAYYFDNYDLSALTMTPSLTNGGGNYFGEVKLAGNGIQAHYIVKKNVNPNDPTVGLCSGELGTISGGVANFCIGDSIIIIDTTVWTDNGTSGWTWLGDFSSKDYEWHIADVSNPCSDYKYVPISAQLFPIRFISDCLFSDFE